MTVDEKKVVVLSEFTKLVIAMRDAQKKYFTTRFRDDLHKSMELEKKVDSMSHDITTGKAFDMTIQPELF